MSALRYWERYWASGRMGERPWRQEAAATQIRKSRGRSHLAITRPGPGTAKRQKTYKEPKRGSYPCAIDLGSYTSQVGSGRDCTHHYLMKLFNTPLLEAFKLRHASSRGALDVWQEHVRMACWASPHDVKRDFPSTDTLGDNRLIFNIKGNSYRLVVKAKYQNGLILIEWVGTHAEYDKKKF